MAAAAAAFVAALSEAQREPGVLASSATSGATGRSCLRWIATAWPIGALDDGQRRLAHELIAAGTSLPGYTKVVSVMAMEHVLRALTPGLADLFDPGAVQLQGVRVAGR